MPEGFTGAQASDWVDPAAATTAAVDDPTTAAQPPVAPTATDAAPEAPAVPARIQDTMEPNLLATWMVLLNFARTTAHKQWKASHDRFSKLRNFATGKANEAARAAQRREAAAAAAAAAESGSRGDGVKSSLYFKMQVQPFAKPEPVPKRSLVEYASDSYLLKRKGVFSKAVDVAELLKFNAKALKKPLRKLPARDMDASAIQANKNIMSFMGDRDSGKDQSGHASKLVKLGLSSPVELRDEIFCQLFMQLTNNPKDESLEAGWRLLLACCAGFTCSDTLMPYLLAFCADQRTLPEPLGPIAQRCIVMIQRCAMLPPRREPPTMQELAAVANGLPVLVRIYRTTGESFTVPLQPWTTAEELTNLAADALMVEETSRAAFAVYEFTNKMEERYLEPNERVLDLVAYWQRLYDEDKSTKDKNAGPMDYYRFVYKVHRYYDPAGEDHAAWQMMYRQAVFDVVSGRYPASDEQCIELAPLQARYELGKGVEGITDKHLPRLLPEAVIQASTFKAEETIAQIKAAAIEALAMSHQETQRAYLDKVRKWPFYGSSFYFVQPQGTTELPSELFMAVNPTGILLVHPTTKEIVKTLGYEEVPSWGHSGSSFVLHVGTLISQSKLYFSTEQGKEINDLVRAYVNYLCM